MPGMLCSVIQGPLSVTGLQTMQHGYVVVPKKQRKIGCHPLLHVGFRQCVGYPLAQIVPLPYAVQVISTGEFSSEIWMRLPSSAHVWLLFSSLAAFRASSFRFCNQPLQGSAQRERCPDRNYTSQCLTVRSLTALSPKEFRYSAT